ncbi:MAG: hypothetical protein A3D94_10660 [Alphaproteobacteria bacterium RIFCSPHIGHO2_12_FULL_66_14]|nr:MAG: hypothetical protein A3D94_10660 [Alphaproteobacteria bacterium RIFCSPHIGHO2_12_FULL_66_14]
MTLGDLTLIYLACGAATLPLSIVALRLVVSLSAASGESREVDQVFDRAVDLSVFLWIVGGLAFYFCAAHIERQKPCGEQRTNQLTAECRRLLGAAHSPASVDGVLGRAVADATLRASSAPRRGPA